MSALAEFHHMLDIATRLHTVTLEPCPKCEGSGEVAFRTGLDTEAVYPCPRCNGAGSVEDDRVPALSTRPQAQLDEEFGKELPF